MSDAIGEITKCYMVRFERQSKHSASRLWRAITDPDEVGAWMAAPAKVDLRVGGEYLVDFHGNGDGALDGIIVRLENQRKLGYVWGVTYAEWVIEDSPDGCRYTFFQNGLIDRGEQEDEEGLAAGWHEFFNHLGDHLDGVTRNDDERTAVWSALRPAYREQLDAVIRGGVAAGPVRPGRRPVARHWRRQTWTEAGRRAAETS